MKAMVLAAGLGTRLGALTADRPKAMVEVGGKPLIWHTLMRLAAAGYDDFVVNVHYKAEPLIAYLQAEPDFHAFRLSISDEREALLDTGGALWKARTLLEGSGGALIHNVDIFSSLPLPFVPDPADPALAFLVVSPRETSRYLLFDEEGGLCGWNNIKTGEVICLQKDADPAGVEPGRAPVERLRAEDPLPEGWTRQAFSGIHYLRDGIFPLMAEYAALHGPAFPVFNFYLWAASRRPVRAVPYPDLRFLDVGTPETLSRAAAFLRK